MGELQYAQISGATHIFLFAETFIGNQTNAEEYFDSVPPPGLTAQELPHYRVPPPCHQEYKT